MLYPLSYGGIASFAEERSGRHLQGRGRREWCAPSNGRLRALGQMGVLSVRFGAVTGRHREQASGKAPDEVESAPHGRRRVMVAGAFLVPVLAATVIAFGMRDEPVAERPVSAGTSVQAPAPSVSKAEPTYGQYIPPQPRPQVETRPPERPPAPVVTPPRKKVSPRPTRPAETRPPCPNGWGYVPHWRQWCLDNGYWAR